MAKRKYEHLIKPLSVGGMDMEMMTMTTIISTRVKPFGFLFIVMFLLEKLWF